MTSPTDATIVPIEITLGGRTGVTLWAPPWEEDGEEWQAFLGTGEKVALFDRIDDLVAYLARSTENDLLDHPAWDMVQTLPADQLVPDEDFRFDFDAVPDLVASGAEEETVSTVGDVVDLAQRIAESADDGPLLQMLEGETFVALAEADDDYDEDEWDDDWADVERTVGASWPLLSGRINELIAWYAEGEMPADAAATGEASAAVNEDFWDSVGILPVVIATSDGPAYTLRCYVDEAAIFLGSDLNVDVFRTPTGLADFCRTADRHDLRQLETWGRVADATMLDITPARSERYDIRTDSSGAREIAGDLLDYCKLDVNLDDWEAAVTEIMTCLRWHD